MRRSGLLVATLLAAALLPTPTGAQSQGVTIGGYAFAPSTVEIAANGSVTWTNADDVTHGVAFAEGPEGCASVEPGGTCVVAFPDVGSFAYACPFHENMTGNVTVRVAASETTPGPTGGAPPVARFAINVSGLVVEADASNATARGNVTAYAWSWGDGNRSTGKIATHRYKASGAYNVTLTVTDDDGANASRTLPVTVVDAPPIARFAANATKLNVTVDASNASDAEGPIARYAWSWGDGARSAGPTARHGYAKPGEYNVTLNVTDASGQNASLTTRVEVRGSLPPVPGFRLHAVGLAVLVDASPSTDPDDAIVSLAWDFGDGNRSNRTEIVHEYGAPGTFAIKLSLVDEDGHVATATRTVNLTTFRVAVNGSNASVDARGVAGEAFAVEEWDFGDGSGITCDQAGCRSGDGANATGPNATHAYDEDGNHTIALTMTAGRIRQTLEQTIRVGAAPAANDTNATTNRTSSSDGTAAQESKLLPGPGALATAGAALSALALFRRRSRRR